MAESADSSEPADRIITCSQKKYEEYSLQTWVVVSQICLVLDRASLEEGQILGVLKKGDVAALSDIKPPWGMLEEGSTVRHPQKRDGAIKLRRSGWVIQEHPTYGLLLVAMVAEKIRRLFEDGLFVKLPFVKGVAKAKPKEPPTEPPQEPPKQLPKELPKEPPKPPPKELPKEPPKPPPAAKPKETTAARAKPESRAADTEASASASAARTEDKARRDSDPSVPSSEAAPAAKADQPRRGSDPSASGKPVRSSEAAAPKARPVPLPREPFREHIRMCSAEHWQVMPQFAFLRGKPSTLGKRLGVLNQDSVICVGHYKNLIPCSDDGLWVKVAKDAKLWTDISSERPERLIKDGTEHPHAFMLKEHDEVGTVVRMVTKHDAEIYFEEEEEIVPVRSVGQERRNSNVRAPICGVEENDGDRGLNCLRIEHWLVQTESCMVYEACTDSSIMELPLWKGDVIILGPRPPRIRIDNGRWWLHLHVGTKVYRDGKTLLGSTKGFCRDAFVLIEDLKGTYVANKKPEASQQVMVVSGVGEPWAVEHDQVVVRQNPDVKAAPLGVLMKGDIIGVKRRQGAWVELVQNFDVRMRRAVSGHSAIWSPNAITPIDIQGKGRVTKEAKEILSEVDATEEAKDGPEANKQRPRVTGWMLSDHEQHGQLLRRVRKRKPVLQGCLLSEQRMNIYKKVIECCHRRIYQENLEELWENNIDLMPTATSLEAKLFETGMYVLHATVNDAFAGGAIIKKLRIRAGRFEGGGSVLSGEVNEEDLTWGRVPVVYIDSCSAEPGMHAGSAIWEAITRMPSLCVVCHSVLLQGTVDFWQSKGMLRMDPTNQTDSKNFKDQMRLFSVGTLTVSLEDLTKKIPSSKLPLFVWMNSKCVARESEPSNVEESTFFKPDNAGEKDEHDER